MAGRIYLYVHLQPKAYKPWLWIRTVLSDLRSGSDLLLPFAHSRILVYLIGAVAATVFEYLVGILMIRMFGELWWDYNEKPFNYKGILCLESTLAWGVYAIIVVYYLHARVLGLADRVGMQRGAVFCKVVLGLYAIDFIYHVLKALGVNVQKYRESIVERCRQFRAKF